MNNKDKSHYANCLFKVPIFRHLNEKEKADITELINVRKLKKGDAIYNAGEKSSFLYIVHQGRYKRKVKHLDIMKITYGTSGESFKFW